MGGERDCCGSSLAKRMIDLRKATIYMAKATGKATSG